jgi:hypothetical protein
LRRTVWMRCAACWFPSVRRMNDLAIAGFMIFH